jgi:IS30 family transposase
MSLKNEVLSLYDKGISAPEIARILGKHGAYVRATLRRNGRRPPLSSWNLSRVERRIAALELELRELRGRRLMLVQAGAKRVRAA